MPRKLFDDEGKEFEVPTEEELKELTTKAEGAGKAEELTKLMDNVREALKLKPEDDVLEAVKNAGEASNPNWSAARNKISQLTTFIKENVKDAKIDEEGNVTAKTETLSKEEVENTASAAATKTINEGRITDFINKHPEDKREVLRKQFDIQAAGGEINPETIAQFGKQAVDIVFPEGTPAPNTVDGGEPDLSSSGEGEDFAKTAEGDKLGDAMGLTLKEPEKGDK